MTKVKRFSQLLLFTKNWGFSTVLGQFLGFSAIVMSTMSCIQILIEYRQDLRLVISGKEQSRVARVPSRYLGPVPVSIFSSFPISTAMEENIGQPALHRPGY